MRLGDASFFPNPAAQGDDSKNQDHGVKESLQNKIQELEITLLQKQAELNFALDAITRLERRVQELEALER